MPSSQHLRTQIEAQLAQRIPSALTPQARTIRPAVPTGIGEIDRLLKGGFPLGALTELVGPECSGRTSLALTFIAARTQEGKVCAWVDVSDTFHPESAAALGVDLSLLLWTRCGVTSRSATVSHIQVPATQMREKPAKVKPGLPQGGSGHPRNEAKGLSSAVNDLLGTTEARCAEALHKPRSPRPQLPSENPPRQQNGFPDRKRTPRTACWNRLEQALRVTDLLLQAGGFNCIVLDMSSLNAEYALRVPLATWFRFRAATERLQMHLLLLTQHTCAKSSAGLVVRMEAGRVLRKEAPVFSGLEHRAHLERLRFPQQPGNVLPIRKPVRNTEEALWQSRAVWAGR
jgi:recombination protein RecA